MRRPAVKKLAPTLSLVALGLLVASDGLARLSVIPGRPGAPRPTASQVAPTPTPLPGGAALRRCQATIGEQSGRLLDEVRDALGDCLVRGVGCLVDEAGSSACCAEAALLCQAELVRIAAATRLFRETVRGGSCGQLALEVLLAGDGLGFDAAACARLLPPVAVIDHASFSDCLQLLLTRDVLHQVGLSDLPRAPEALVCMGLDEILVDALGIDPATCEPSPSPPPPPSPTPTPPPTPVPTGTDGLPLPTPTPAPPTPSPTPSPGEGGCQPRHFGPCEDGTFTGCCRSDLNCVHFIGEDAPGYCIADPPIATETPPATPTPAATSSPGGATPTPGSTTTPSPTPSGTTPTPTATPGRPTPSPGGETPTPSPTATAGSPQCSTLQATVSVNYNPTGFPDVAGMTVNLVYPASVSIPGFGSDASVLQRVTNLTGVNGLFNVGDQDDSIGVGLVSLAATIPPGDFIRIQFDCVSGPPPVAADFDCTPDVSTTLGNQVDASCAVTAITTSP